MAMLKVTVTENGMCRHGTSDPVQPHLSAALQTDPGPVTILIHGFKYLPSHPLHCPHKSIFSNDPQRPDKRVVSWPRRLGLRGRAGSGFALGFGWNARGSIWTAHRRAAEAGHHLATLIAQLRLLAPNRPVHLVAHSLGARVALRAISLSAPNSINRVVLLAAAEYSSTARAALTSPGGQSCDVLNVASRENDLFDFLIERLIAPPDKGSKMLGLGNLHLRNLVTLQLDDPRSLRHLRHAGYPIADPTRRICHWSPYMRPGVFPLYRAFLSDTLPLSRLRVLVPRGCSPRWSRLLACAPLLRSNLPIK